MGAVYEPTAFIVGAADDYTPPKPPRSRSCRSRADSAHRWPWRATQPSTRSATSSSRHDPVQIDPENASLRTMGVRFVLDSWVYDQLSAPERGRSGHRQPARLRRGDGQRLGARAASRGRRRLHLPRLRPCGRKPPHRSCGRAMRPRGPPPSTTPGWRASPPSGIPTGTSSLRT